jgi:phage gp45-like
MDQRLIARMMAPLARAVSNMASRASVVLANSAGKLQRLQVRILNGETKSNLDHAEPYGFTSCPHPGAEAVLLFMGGDRSHGIAIVVGDRRYRLQALEAGEVAVYDDLQQMVALKRDGIYINTPLDIDLRGRNVRIHGEESLIVECNGHGEKWLPDRKDTYTIGAVAGSSNPINAPDIPE